MKIAISVPSDLYESADRLAEELGISRSELFARAMEEFLARHRHQDLTARLNEVYAEEDSGLDAGLRRAQGRSVRSGEW